MISLNIEKTFGFISKASVAAYEAQVKASWAGCTSLHLSVKSIWPT